MSTLREINGEASVCNDGCPLRPCPCGDDRCYTCDPDGVPQAVAALMQPDPDTVCVSRNDLAEVLWHAGPMPAHASEAAIRMWGSRGDDWRGSLTSCPDREATR